MTVSLGYRIFRNYMLDIALPTKCPLPLLHDCPTKFSSFGSRDLESFPGFRWPLLAGLARCGPPYSQADCVAQQCHVSRQCRGWLPDISQLHPRQVARHLRCGTVEVLSVCKLGICQAEGVACALTGGCLIRTGCVLGMELPHQDRVYAGRGLPDRDRVCAGQGVA